MNGRIAFITGASRGAGAAIARVFHEAGARVALASRSGDDLGLDGALGLKCSVCDADSVEKAVHATAEHFGGIDVVVANAGVGSHGSVCDIPLEDIDAMIDVNLKGTIYTARYTVPHLISSQGDFISLASVAGLRAFPGEAVYNASKFGQVGFTRALDHELREHGVRVTNVAPGGIATDFAMGKGRTPDMPELEGMMSAEEVADVVLFAVTRPRGMRMMTMSFRPMSEPSWG
jgi:NAD(P)-dependent dehydrogenase (short-subunit alcohol dehydrogenase family)